MNPCPILLQPDSSSQHQEHPSRPVSRYRDITSIYYLEVECFVEVRLDVPVKDISLSVSLLKITLSRVFIKKIDQSIWILTLLARQLCLPQMNIETTCSIVNPQTKSSCLQPIVCLPSPYFVWSGGPLTTLFTFHINIVSYLCIILPGESWAQNSKLQVQMTLQSRKQTLSNFQDD